MTQVSGRTTAVWTFVLGQLLLADIGSGRTKDEVPFRLVAGFLIVADGSIGSLQNLGFIIDTGTARTVIHNEIASKLGLPSRPLAMDIFGEQVLANGVVAPSMRFGPVHRCDVHVLTANLQPQSQRFGVMSDAIVGMDMLGDRCLTIDYDRKAVAFECTGGWRLQASLEPSSSLPIVNASINETTYRLIVDSGSEVVVIFDVAIPSGADVSVDAEVAATHLTGNVRLKRFTPERFSIGGHSVGTPPVFILDYPGGSPGYDGVLGSRWLPGSRVHLDLVRRVLGWS